MSFADEDLNHPRANRRCLFTDLCTINRYFTPTENNLPLFAYDLFENSFLLVTETFIFMSKDHTYAIFTSCRQLNTKHFTLTLEELVRNLYQNTGTIPCVLIGTSTTTMFKALQNAQTIVDNIMRFFSLNINNEAHATRILFKLAAIHAIGFESSLI